MHFGQCSFFPLSLRPQNASAFESAPNGAPVSVTHTHTVTHTDAHTVLCSPGVYPPVSGVPQGGPLRRPSAVLGLLPPAPHETLQLFRLPAALRLLPPHLLTGSGTQLTPPPAPPLAGLTAGSMDSQDLGFGRLILFLRFKTRLRILESCRYWFGKGSKVKR